VGRLYSPIAGKSSSRKLGFRYYEFSETELPGVVVSEIVLMVKEKEPQRWKLQKNPTLEFLGFAGSA
jgi:hypothetical protein